MCLCRAALISAVIVACSCVHDTTRLTPLEHTPILVRTPSGFVHSPWISTDSPAIYFSLPKGPDGGTPGYPQLSVTEVNPIREPDSVSSYVARLQINEHAKVFIGPRTDTVLGRPATEIATEWTTIFDFADGTAASGQTTRHEIIFEFRGHFYICKLAAHPEIHSKWVGNLREFCHGLEATNALD
jgi:hypothetical protein